jgi:hypothetical protein
MSDSLRPPLSERPAPASGRFARFAALFSFAAPCLAILFYLCLFYYLSSHDHAKLSAAGGLSIIPVLLILSGLVLGLVALVLPKRHRGKGIFGFAITGVCLNGFVIILNFSIPLLARTFLNHHPRTPEARLEKAMNALTNATDEVHRFYALDDAAKESFVVGDTDDARKFATELLDLAPKYSGDWNYGNAIQDGNLVLGRIAVKEGRIEDAKKFLLAAGSSKGSPQMDSFGPNMSLAKDLLEKGERDTVLQYFELCRRFWETDHGKLDDWTQQVKAGKIPHFGANLVY